MGTGSCGRGDSPYELWKVRRRLESSSLRFDPVVSPDIDLSFADAGSYLAFATPEGIEAELIFMNPVAEPAEQLARERELLLVVETELAREARQGFAPSRLEALALEVRRMNRDYPVFDIGWCGAPSRARIFAIEARRFAGDALEDVRRRLGSYPRPKLRLPT